jgi:hypothetical protein
MSSWPKLDRFLATDPDDVGCAETFDCIDVYVELTSLGLRAELRYPGVAAHLRACHPCAEDFEGLLASVGASPAAH